MVTSRPGSQPRRTGRTYRDGMHTTRGDAVGSIAGADHVGAGPARRVRTLDRHPPELDAPPFLRRGPAAGPSRHHAAAVRRAPRVAAIRAAAGCGTARLRHPLVWLAARLDITAGCTAGSAEQVVSGPRVLVVDDDTTVNDVVARYLSRARLRCLRRRRWAAGAGCRGCRPAGPRCARPDAAWARRFGGVPAPA